MKFNVDAFKAIRSGHGLSSPTIGKTEAMISGIADAETALQELRIAGFDPVKIDQMETLLAASKDSGSVFSGHAASQLEGMTGTMGMSAAVKKVQSVADALPPSCGDMNAVLGSITGAVDGVIDGVSGAIGELAGAVADYIAGTLDDLGLSAVFDSVSSAVISGIDALKSRIASETGLIAELRQLHRQFADACSLDGLSKDPCARVLIEKTAAPELKAALNMVS